MNKYQKQINKNTKRIINQQIKDLNECFVKDKPIQERQNGKSTLRLMGVMEYLAKMIRLESKSHYRKVRKDLRQGNTLQYIMQYRGMRRHIPLLEEYCNVDKDIIDSGIYVSTDFYSTRVK